MLVHGGSGETDALGKRLGREPEFVTSPSGQTSRACDRETVEIFAQATALVNRRLVEDLRAAGVDAIGLSGLDAGLVEADRKALQRAVVDGRRRVLRDQWTGRPRKLRRELLDLLLEQGMLPVLAPLAGSAAGEMLNVDGDRMAACVAGGLGAQDLVILSNVPGLLRRLDDPESLIRWLDVDAADELAKGRMRKKVMAAREALEAGVARVQISSSSLTDPLSMALSGGGTRLQLAARAEAKG